MTSISTKSLPRILALCGRKQAGKDTVAEYLCTRYGYKHVKFAEPLKDAMTALFGFTRNQIEHDKEVCDEFWNISPRQAMQFFGVEVMQFEIQKLLPEMGRGFFVKRLLQKYEHERIVISDMRFVHEFKAIRAIPDAAVLKLVRPLQEGVAPDMHLSETEVDQVRDCALVQNDGSIPDLLDKVEQFMRGGHVESSVKGKKY